MKFLLFRERLSVFIAIFHCRFFCRGPWHLRLEMSWFKQFCFVLFGQCPFFIPAIWMQAIEFFTAICSSVHRKVVLCSTYVTLDSIMLCFQARAYQWKQGTKYDLKYSRNLSSLCLVLSIFRFSHVQFNLNFRST